MGAGFYQLGWVKGHDSSGRDENSIAGIKYFAGTTELSSRPERTRISYFALLATTTCAALGRESRMQILNATGLHRKSGGAQWRDLRFLFRCSHTLYSRCVLCFSIAE
jgi:hypothetical protein